VHQTQILDSFRQVSRREYTPRFRAEQEPRGWRVYDGGEAIAFFFTDSWFAFDIWRFSPFEAALMANVDPPGKVWDLHTAHNTCINFPFTSGHDLVEGVDDPFGCCRQEWLSDAGDELHFRITAEFGQGQRLAYNVRVAYDPDWARYRFFFNADVWKLEFHGMEPINMMLAGALESRPDRRRWTHSIWEDPNGKLRRLVHSNALFTVTDFGDVVTEVGMGAQWRTKNAPFPGGWIAYAAHADFNPAMIVHETTAPVCFATCSQLFDEHLIWRNTGLENLEEGYFHFVMHTEFVNLLPEIAAQFLEQAEDPPKPAKWRNSGIALPFEMGVENSFETELDPWVAEECPVLVLSSDSAAAIQWADGQAHSGQRSIRLRGTRMNERNELFPGGAVCNVEPHTRYLLSGWVKTDSVDRYARLELSSYEYRYTNVVDLAQTPPVCGTSDWTRVEAELDSGDEAYLMPKLVLYGPGTAWFDDVTLSVID